MAIKLFVKSVHWQRWSLLKFKVISKKSRNTGISWDMRAQLATHLLLLRRKPWCALFCDTVWTPTYEADAAHRQKNRNMTISYSGYMAAFLTPCMGEQGRRFLYGNFVFLILISLTARSKCDIIFKNGFVLIEKSTKNDVCGRGGMADALVLGTSGQPCRFMSCRPHQPAVPAPNYRCCQCSFKPYHTMAGVYLSLFTAPK